MMDFTQDERNMMMLYSPGTRSGLCEALTLMKEQLSEDESELFALADSVLRKVSAMDDAAFEKVTPREMVAIEKALSVSLAMEQLKKRSPKHKAKRAKE